MERIAAIILNYNTYEDTLKEVDRLVNKLHFKEEDILVVDNKSTNDSAIKLKEKLPGETILLLAEENKGYAAGNNIGLRMAREKGYKFALILNNDILVEDEKLMDRLLKVFEADKSIATVNPDIYSMDGHMFNRDAVRPSFYDLTLGIFAYRKKGRQIKNLGGYGYIYRPQGCFMLADLDKMAEVDYFDDSTFLYEEELILAERLLGKSYKCACHVESQVIHNHSKTIKTIYNSKKIRDMKLESFNYYLKQYRGYNKLKVFTASNFYRLKLIMLDMKGR